MKKTLLILFSLLSVFYINAGRNKTIATHDSIPDLHYQMYLKWNDSALRDSILNTIPDIRFGIEKNEYPKETFIKRIQGVKRLPRYTRETRNNFKFLFADSLRFKNNKKKVAAIVFQGSSVQRRFINEIMYITLDKSFDSNVTADMMPLYEGGYDAMIRYLNETISIPDGTDTVHQDGEVLLGFIVDESGSINKVKILESANDILDREAYRLVKSMPKWKPGLKNGNVPVFLTIQLVFRP